MYRHGHTHVRHITYACMFMRERGQAQEDEQQLLSSVQRVLREGDGTLLGHLATEHITAPPGLPSGLCVLEVYVHTYVHTDMYIGMCIGMCADLVCRPRA